MLLCGGGNDPTVFYASNTQTMAGTPARGGTAGNPTGSFWQAEVTGGLVTVIDVDTTATGDPFDPIRAGFAAAVTATAAAAGGGPAGQQAVVQAYHGTLVPPFCSKATQQYFAGVLTLLGFPYP